MCPRLARDASFAFFASCACARIRTYVICGHHARTPLLFFFSMICRDVGKKLGMSVCMAHIQGIILYAVSRVPAKATSKMDVCDVGI